MKSVHWKSKHNFGQRQNSLECVIIYLTCLALTMAYAWETISTVSTGKMRNAQKWWTWTHNNPSMQEFQKNMQALRVINSFAKGTSKGEGILSMVRTLLMSDSFCLLHYEFCARIVISLELNWQIHHKYGKYDVLAYLVPSFRTFVTRLLASPTSKQVY